LPLVAVHHLAGHIESLVLQNGELPLPAVVLVVSGGHTSLYLVETPGRYELLSRTRDDAAGEAYDKVAKLLGLGYPGGPVIDRLAKTGNDRAVALPTTRLTHADRNAPELKGDLDFSFSGLKTAVLRYVRSRGVPGTEVGGGTEVRPTSVPDTEIADICASFQRVVVTALLDRLFDAARRYQARSIGIAGGVSANSRLRAELADRGNRREMPTYPSEPATVDRQCRDDCGCRPAKASSRDPRAGGPERRRRARVVATMAIYTDYLWFNTKKRQEFVRITDEIEKIVAKSGVDDGFVLVSAMHITAGVYVNDWEDGLIEDFQVWLEKLAPGGPRLSSSPDRRRQRRCASEAHPHGAPGDGADHQREAGPRTVGAGLLRRVRRPAEEARRREGHGRDEGCYDPCSANPSAIFDLSLAT
jgi:glycoprotease/Kae1 family metallohydrolase